MTIGPVTAQPVLSVRDQPDIEFVVTARAGTAFREAADAAHRAMRERFGDDLAGFRSVPLLLVAGQTGQRRIVVGEWFIARVGARVHAEAAVRGVWVEQDQWRRASMVADHLSVVLQHGPYATPHGARNLDDQTIVTVATKATIESSRNSVTSMREICYELSERIAEGLRADSTASPAHAIPELMSVRTAISLARDEAREALREQFDLWRDDDEAYHRYRRAIDPTLMTEHNPADSATRPWMRTHDAAIRQARAMDEQLAEQIELLSGTLAVASTMWTAQQARASEGLNTVASAAAVGLGIPSLVLAYYGATELLSLHAPSAVLALVPLILGALPVAFVLRGHRPRWWPWGQGQWAVALGLTLAGGVLLLGLFAHWVLS